MKRILLGVAVLSLLAAWVTPLRADPELHKKKEAIRGAMFIAVVEIGEVKAVDVTGKYSTPYRQAAAAKVKQPLKGELPKEFVIHAAEGTKAGTNKYDANSTYLVFLTKSGDHYRTFNWHLGHLKVSKDETVQWFKDDDSLEQAETKLAEAVKQIQAQQVAEIKALIEQLVFSKGNATNQPVLSPGVDDESKEYRTRYKSCQNAFKKLAEFKGLAFPIMVEHLGDKRQSINFRNHVTANSVGDACYWNIYYQLQDEPENYSEYGYARTGRDGKNHPKPYWEGTPFDDAGGLKEWLEQNKALSYPQMQVKCLQWLLDREKAIGASDAASYCLNILPLEIRILERRQDAGENVATELERLRTVLTNKDAKQIPAELLPGK